MEKSQNAKSVEGILTRMLGKVTQEVPEDGGMNQATKTMLAKIAEVDEAMKNTEDKRPSMSKASHILEEYSSTLEGYLGNIIAQNTKVEVELEATLEEIARQKQENPHCALPGPRKEAEGVEVDIPPKE